MRARDVMSAPVITVPPTASVQEIAQLLLDKRISAVPVIRDDGVVIGIVSEGDLLRRGETSTARPRQRWLDLLLNRDVQAGQFVREHGPTARDVMSADVIAVDPDADLAEVAHLLEQRRIKRVPVLENGRLVGIVSRANLLHALVAYKGSLSGVEATGDPQIRQEVEARLASEPWVDLDRLNVVVTDGVVHLWGAVDSDERRRALVIAAQSTPGVKGVQDHLSHDTFASRWS